MGTAEVDRLDRPDDLPEWEQVLVVVAHPDDETFGLGGVIHHLTSAGVTVEVICLTRGEASTLGEGDLPGIRSREAVAAASHLGIDRIRICDHPDGALDEVDDAVLVEDVQRAIARGEPDGLLVFGPGGVTGHRDHIAATRAGVTAAAPNSIPTLGLVIPTGVADALNTTLGTTFVGVVQPDVRVEVDRARQLEAARLHASQMNPVLVRRLELLGSEEWLVWMDRSTSG